MEFTKSFFQHRLAHILKVTADQGAVCADLRLRRTPAAFRFSRKRQPRAADASPPSLSSRVAVLTRSVDQLVLEYGRSQRLAPQAGFPFPKIAIAEVDGHVLWAPASDWKLVCHYLISAGFDPGLVHFFRKNVKPAGVFLDIGASLGAYTILAAVLTGEDGVVHSFEAATEAYRWLVRNVDECGFASGGRVRPKQVWVGNPSGAVGDMPDSLSPTAAVDDLVSPGGRVDWVRIGAQNGISEVLRCMSRVCRENPQCRIIIDYCAALHPGQARLLSIVDQIAGMGYSIQRIDGRTGETAQLRPDDAAGAFSINLLLEQGGEMRWSG